nr:GCN5-related N-acetyltransferase [uncultured bacterium]
MSDNLTHALLCRSIDYGSPEYHQALTLRFDVLRKPLGIAFDPERLKLESADLHFACFQGERLVATLILTPLSVAEAQMRQFAVANGLQKSGIGRTLMAHAERCALEYGFVRISMHAREIAIPFYEKHGYAKVGDRFYEVTLPHFVMAKDLETR